MPSDEKEGDPVNAAALVALYEEAAERYTLGMGPDHEWTWREVRDNASRMWAALKQGRGEKKGRGASTNRRW